MQCLQEREYTKDISSKQFIKPLFLFIKKLGVGWPPSLFFVYLGMEEIIIKQEAISTYVNLLKEKFGTNLGLVIEEVLFDSMNMDFNIPETWNDEEFAKWAKMDLTWNASEGGEEGEIGADFAEDLFKGNLSLYGIENYFI